MPIAAIAVLAAGLWIGAQFTPGVKKAAHKVDQKVCHALTIGKRCK